MPHPPSNPFPEISAFFKSIGASPAAPVSVAAGVSGGADSVALLHILHEYRADLGIGRLAVAHVNHGLRGAESDGDEDFVRGEAERLGVEFFCTRLDGINNDDGIDTIDSDNIIGDVGVNGDTGINTDISPRPSIDTALGLEQRPSGIEAWARRERYKFFAKIRQNHGFDRAATAHTANDQAETVLLRLTRGAGLRGLRGILPARGDGVVRPMLDVERRRLLEWLSARGVGYRVDSSNADLRFRRNRIRAEVIPKLLECDAAAVRNLAAAAAAAQTAWREIEGRAGEWIGKYVLRVSPEIFHVEKAGLTANATANGGAIALAPVREALLVLFDEYGIPPFKLHIERVESALSGTPSGASHLLPGGWVFYCREDRVCFVKKGG